MSTPASHAKAYHVYQHRKAARSKLTPLPDMSEAKALIAKVKASVKPASASSTDVKEAESEQMTKMLEDRLKDLHFMLNSVHTIVAEDVNPSFDINRLAVDYLKLSDHTGPGISNRTQRSLRRKVDSLGDLAKRMKVTVASDVEKGTDLYYLRQYYKGNRIPEDAEASGDGDESADEVKAAEQSNTRRPPMSPGTALSRVQADQNGDLMISPFGRRADRGKQHQLHATPHKLRDERAAVVRAQEAKDNAYHNARLQRSEATKQALHQIVSENPSVASRVLQSPVTPPFANGKAPFEINASLLLSYIADTIRITEGIHVEEYIRHYLLQPVTQKLFEELFWYVSLKVFPHPSDCCLVCNNVRKKCGCTKGTYESRSRRNRDCETLLQRISHSYVRVINSVHTETHKGCFFRYMPFALGGAVIKAFYFYFFGSASKLDKNTLEGKGNRRKVFLEVSSALSGLELYPLSANIMSEKLFNDVIIDAPEVPLAVALQTSDASKMGAGKVGGVGGGKRVRKKPRRTNRIMQVGALWIPPGNLQGGRKLPNEGTSPLICRFLGRPAPRGSPLTTKRSSLPRRPRRLQNLYESVSKSKETIDEIKKRHKYKNQLLWADIKEERFNRDEEIRGVLDTRKKILGAGIAMRQRFTFDLVKKSKSAKVLR